MNTRSFASAAVRGVCICFTAALIAACAPPVGSGGGNLRIILGGGARSLSPATAAALSYELDFSGPGGETFSRAAGPGEQSITLSLAPGEWNISARAFLGGRLYGTGTAAVIVEAGKTNDAAIDMRPVDCYLTLYVSQSGSDNNDGRSADAPFATVNKALEVIWDEYADAGDDWPGTNSVPAAARILISGTVTKTGEYDSMVAITDDGLYVSYPPIILAGQGEGALAGTLNANHTGRVLFILNAAVILGENLTLTGGTSSNSDNIAGGGVYVEKGSFTMTGGSISGNTADYNGGGVYIDEGRFTMSGGTMSGNTASFGGGVFVYHIDSSFTMSGGTISGNNAESGGNGVYVESGTFAMNGGTISMNGEPGYESSRGGGVGVNNGTFTMNEGSISGNTAGLGGGVFVDSGGTFTMSGGTISGNTAGYGGGGVYVLYGAFLKTGGIIYGINAADPLKNEAPSDGQAAGAYAEGNVFLKRDATAGTGDKLDSAKIGPEGGWDEQPV